MRKLTIYVDTSFIGGYFDEEFSNDTKLLFDEILRGDLISYENTKEV